MESNIEVKENGSVKSAIESISVIRDVINRSEVNMRRLGKLFLIYGLVTLGVKALRTVFMMAFVRFFGVTAEQAAAISESFTLISAATTVILFVLFLIMRKNTVSTEGRYTMKLFDLWGAVLFFPAAMSVITVIIELILSVFGADSQASTLFLNIITKVMVYGVVCAAIFFTGHYTDRTFMKILSAVLLLLFPILTAVYFPAEAAGYTPTSMLAGYGIFTKITSVAYMAVNFIYIILGIVFLAGQRGASDGNE